MHRAFYVFLYNFFVFSLFRMFFVFLKWNYYVNITLFFKKKYVIIIQTSDLSLYNIIFVTKESLK